MESTTDFTHFIVNNTKLLTENPFCLVDVGVSGGFTPKWSIFANQLCAFGFDPLIKECDRLNHLESYGNMTYVPAFVGAPQNIKFPGEEVTNNIPAQRLSVTQAMEKMESTSNERYNSFQEVIFSDNNITLDDYFYKKDNKLDFLKIDTDGHDIEVLYGATRLFEDNNFLGICIESQFHGAIHPRANTFANIDIFLREQGFSLFDMEYHRYSRRELPGKFLLSIPAQTDTGQIQWADAYYFRDLGDKDYKKKWQKSYSRIDIIKLACLFELHNLHDCAVELLTLHKKDLQCLLDVDQSIGLLVPPLNKKAASLQDYHVRFEKSIESMHVLEEGELKGMASKHKGKLQAYKKIVLFGAGGRLKNNLSEIKSYFAPNVTFVIMDNDSTKWGEKLNSHPIVSPEELIDNLPDIVVIVSTYAHEILEQLIKYKDDNKLTFEISTF